MGLTSRTRQSQRRKILWCLFIAMTIVFSGSLAYARGENFFGLFHGNLSNRYRLKASGGVSDQDLLTLVTLDIGDSTYQRFTGALQAGGAFDLNGNQTGNLNGIYDTFSSDAIGRIYYAYLNVQKVTPFELVRVGRQHNYDFESFYFDGISFESKPFYGFRVSAYGGVPVHLYENTFGWGGSDWMVGSALSWTPIQAVRIRFDYAHLRDESSSFRVTQANQEDDLLGTTFWVDFSKNVSASGRFTSFADQARDLSFQTKYRIPKWDLWVAMSFYRLLNAYDIRVPDLDAYAIAGTYQPYMEFTARVNKGFGQHFNAEAGFGLRTLDDAQVASAFNHGFKHGFLSLSTSDFPLDNLGLTLTGDYYHGEDNTLKNNFFGLSFLASKHFFKKKLILSGGTSYYFYRFNFATGNESRDVQTYFGGVEGKLAKHIKTKADYEFENNAVDEFHTFTLKMILDF